MAKIPSVPNTLSKWVGFSTAAVMVAREGAQD
jgi:hypothetical protein